FAKKAMDRLSGDQKGNVAPLVPLSGSAIDESSARIYNNDFPSAPLAASTIFDPSGDNTAPARSNENVAVSGALIDMTNTRCGARQRTATIAATAARVARTFAMTSQSI